MNNMGLFVIFMITFSTIVFMVEIESKKMVSTTVDVNPTTLSVFFKLIRIGIGYIFTTVFLIALLGFSYL